MAAFSKYLTAKNSCLACGGLLLLYLLRHRSQARRKLRSVVISLIVPAGKDGKKDKAAVDKVFFFRILRILRIMVPRFFSMETAYLLLIATMLVARTYCDVWMIQNGTMIESAIIGRSTKDFKIFLFSFIKFMPIIALVNNFLKLGLNELKLRFRERLTKKLYDQYLQGFTYYKMGNLDNRIANADQLLTQDVEKFCNSVVDLYSNLSKPLLDIFLYIFKLTSAIGAQGPAVMMTYLLISGLFLTRLRRPIGKMTVAEQRFEGEYRYVNSRLITNSEEIAFYNGNMREKQTIHATFKKLVDHLHNFIFFRFSMGFVDSIIAKYVATVVGYLVVSRPFLNLSDPRHLHSTHSELGRRLIKLISSINLHLSLISFLFVFPAGLLLMELMVSYFWQNINYRGLISNFSWVTLCCTHYKCSQERIFIILWPLFGGSLTKPERGKLFYVPQRPYMTLGSLRDQVIYPDSVEEQRRKGISDQILKEYLDNVQLGHILDREGSWDAVQDWMDVLSGGEKQRMAMARLFYHKPQFAILDECTSAVSVDVEDYIYSHCRTVGISLFTVSHRKSLWKHHEYYLHMDGRGNYEFKPITQETVEFGS
uniref:ATP-binding cassette, sub-family D (ALD), member 3a n=1 Tax=Fundulus heteroclitus TaxID=8078 RepID=A0A3Q2PXT9_FUNHE